MSTIDTVALSVFNNIYGGTNMRPYSVVRAAFLGVLAGLVTLGILWGVGL